MDVVMGLGGPGQRQCKCRAGNWKDGEGGLTRPAIWAGQSREGSRGLHAKGCPGMALGHELQGAGASWTCHCLGLVGNRLGASTVLNALSHSWNSW